MQRDRTEDLIAAEKAEWKDVPLYLNNTGKVGFYIVTKNNGYLWLNVDDIPPKHPANKSLHLTPNLSLLKRLWANIVNFYWSIRG